MAENEIDKKIEQMLPFENGDDDQVTNLQSQVATLMEQIQKLLQQAGQREQPPEVDNTSTSTSFRKAMNQERDRAPFAELTPFNLAEAERNASEKELSMIRAGELITQLTEWKEYVELFNTLEQSKQEEAYEKLKNLAQSIERSQQVAKAVQFSLRASQENNLSSRQSGNRDHIPPDNYKNEHQLHTVACSFCKKQGHFKRDCWKNRGARNKECPALPSSTPSNSAPFDRQSSSRNQKEQGPKVQTFTTTLDKWEFGRSKST
ncbi:hypothetical protein V3C99_018011 [Haemonchus contortus]|uniref:CCHC-type domain-containing protein n=1 Tax=Haemonchus contortus TaxID=6289 RepID=A0A7I4Z282_HAECO